MRMKKAFTLVETLLAMTIFAFIGAGIAMSFFSGMKLWSRASSTDNWYNNVILNFEIISKELRQSFEIPQIGFQGDSKSFSFPGLSGNTIVMITYSYDAASRYLTRSEVKLADIIEESAKIDKKEKSVFAAQELSIQYMKVDKSASSLEWVDSWKKEDGIFCAVRLKGISNGQEFQKTIFIPVAQ